MLAQFHRRLAIEKVPSTHKKTKTKPHSFVSLYMAYKLSVRRAAWVGAVPVKVR